MQDPWKECFPGTTAAQAEPHAGFARQLRRCAAHWGVAGEGRPRAGLAPGRACVILAVNIATALALTIVTEKYRDLHALQLETCYVPEVATGS